MFRLIRRQCTNKYLMDKNFKNLIARLDELAVPLPQLNEEQLNEWGNGPFEVKISAYSEDAELRVRIDDMRIPMKSRWDWIEMVRDAGIELKTITDFPEFNELSNNTENVAAFNEELAQITKVFHTLLQAKLQQYVSSTTERNTQLVQAIVAKAKGMQK